MPPSTNVKVLTQSGKKESDKVKQKERLLDAREKWEENEGAEKKESGIIIVGDSNTARCREAVGEKVKETEG